MGTYRPANWTAQIPVRHAILAITVAPRKHFPSSHCATMTVRGPRTIVSAAGAPFLRPGAPAPTAEAPMSTSLFADLLSRLYRDQPPSAADGGARRVPVPSSNGDNGES